MQDPKIRPGVIDALMDYLETDTIWSVPLSLSPMPGTDIQLSRGKARITRQAAASVLGPALQLDEEELWG